MRLSPLLVAFLAASATLGLSPSAKGQTAKSPLAGTKPVSGSAIKPASKAIAPASLSKSRSKASSRFRQADPLGMQPQMP